MELTPEQEALGGSVRDLIRHNPRDQVASGGLLFHDPGVLRPDNTPNTPGSWKTTPRPGFDPVLWRLLCQFGVPALAIPEQLGGSGAGPVELAVVAHELGRALAPVPFLGSAVLATAAIVAAGDQAATAALLPGLASGSRMAALAWTGQAGRWDPAEPACCAKQAGGEAGLPDRQHRRRTRTTERSDQTAGR